MKTQSASVRNARGFTLIEVLIALILTGLVTVAIMNTYVTQHENYIVQDDVTTMQQSSRASIDELTRQIRMAGHHLPNGLAAIVASNTNPDTITITYHGNDCETYLSDPMPQPSAELKCGSDISCFRPDQWVYIYEPDSAAGEWFKISEVQTAAGHLQHRYDPKELSRRYGANSIILSLNRVKFFVDNTTAPDNPKLMLQIGFEPPVIYADRITDLQFRYRLANGSIVDEPVLITDIREVLIAISAGSGLPPLGGDPAKDRTYTSSVSLRNIGV
ncbi:MAG: prepilin-type N-terminal cleavage/methylation domain-containing protein [Candidatus Zixiibacteriota bacterium]